VTLGSQFYLNVLQNTVSFSSAIQLKTPECRKTDPRVAKVL